MGLTDDFDEDDRPQLDASTMALLQEFYTERDEREKQFEDLKAKAEDEFDCSKPLSMDLFTESWQDSQFWYKDETATVLAEQLLDGVTEDSKIAVVSAPSVYIQLRNLLNDRERYPIRPKLMLLEFDERFGVFKDDFSFYDYKQPFKLDPALTVRWLAKTWEAPLKLVQCTGERMESLAHKLYGKAARSSHNTSTMAAACIFCKIIKGEIPSMKLFESEKVFAFLDINPLSYGHALVIPKYHGAKLHDIPDDQLTEILPVAKKIAQAIGAGDYNILQNNGRIAHQVVDHVHFHMIPKPNEQEGLGIKWPQQQGNQEKLKKLREEIMSKM
ncbi:N-6 adenine-specific DNA methyltransferase-like protein 2 [Aureobasidium subglaciale]|nr:N-6 adenine-specific DNA methyltransferase-like protein 2 [Aureobasidium subglaciale]KAI5234731.1 N-6 adenine-specific DNA methyltransferase-like protein 2 [Aureobasidium subglaciale]KAI5268363.1 N-6 adenine-specific DNA methyltransferase-like protein 2 [Aureobasidium subglaciale]